VGKRLIGNSGTGENAEFGKPEYEAVSDYLHLQQLVSSLKLNQANAKSKPNDPEGKMHWESQARITEQEIALHKTQIYQKQSRVQGYDSAYTHVGINFEHDLISAARRDAEVIFAGDEEQQSYYVRGFQTKYVDKAQGIIFGKRG
jgi:hypothetical protein